MGDDGLLIVKKPYQNYWVKYGQDRTSLKKNKNFLVICVGDTGSGKSYGMLRYGELLDPSFNIGRVVFNGKELMKVVNSKLKRGSVVIYDECGVDINARNWYTVMNKMINYMLQTFRYMGITVLFTVPDLSFVDSATRKLFHAYFQPVRINYEKKILTMKAQLIQNNPKLGKVYYKKLKVCLNGETRKVRHVGFSLPSKELREAYEKKKREFSHKLNADIETTINGQSYSHESNPKRMTKKQEQIYALVKEGYNQKEIADILGVSAQIISKQIHYIKKKGHLQDNEE